MEKTKPINSHLACPCGMSSGGWTEYTDHNYCFSCGKYENTESEIEYQIFDNDKDVTFQYVGWRGVSRETMEKYDVKCKVVGDTPTELHFPYANGRTQVRSMLDKEFKTIGELKSSSGFIFGVDKFTPGSA